MKLIVIIPTFNRAAILDRTLAFLERQSRRPDEVIVTAPDESHVHRRGSNAYELRWIFGGKGLCAQRNRALEDAAGRSDIITFFDDDFLPAPDYLQHVEDFFKDNPDWAVLRGIAIIDGAHNEGVSFDDGVVALAEEVSRRAENPIEPRISDQVGGYGCNMSVRSAFVGDLRFDERLPLYGWQEDIDFTNRMGQFGRIVASNMAYGVHLGTKSGRVSGLRLGYSQLVNPIYLMRKGTVPRGFAVNLIMRNLAANLVKSVWPEPYIDRRGRLRGNLLAAMHLARGKIEPEHILKL